MNPGLSIPVFLAPKTWASEIPAGLLRECLLRDFSSKSVEGSLICFFIDEVLENGCESGLSAQKKSTKDYPMSVALVIQRLGTKIKGMK